MVLLPLDHGHSDGNCMAVELHWTDDQVVVWHNDRTLPIRGVTTDKQIPHEMRDREKKPTKLQKQRTTI